MADQDQEDVQYAGDRQRKVLTLEMVQRVDDISSEWFPVPEWAPAGAPDPDAYGFYIKALNGRERADWQQKSIMGGGRNITANFQNNTVLLVVYSCVDQDGKRVFTEADAKALLRKSSRVLERIAERAMAVSGINDEEMQAIAGNSEASPSDE